MRPVAHTTALGLIIVGSLGIAGVALALVVVPGAVPLQTAALVLIGLAGLMILLGLSGFRYQGIAWQALADHLGHELLNLEAVNSTITDHVCAFGAGGVVSLSPGFLPLFNRTALETPEQLADSLTPATREGFLAAVQGLADAGEQFIRTVTTSGGQQLDISGHRATLRPGQPALFVLRVRDVTLEREASSRESKLREEASRHGILWQARLDALPIPVWIRREDLSLAWLNRAAADLLECTAHVALDEQREPFVGALGEDGRWLAEQSQLDGQARSEFAAIVTQGDRKLYHVTELPLNQPGAAFLGCAVDFTRLDDREKELKRHIEGNAAVLERLNTAIAIYGPDQRLRFYNQAFVDLWRLPESFLRNTPSYGEVLEELRAGRMLMEQADFAGWRRAQLALFTSLIEPQEELQHLPDGRMLRALVAPHPFGGLMFVYEDVSRRYELETSYNTLQAVQHETLNNLAQAVCVYGSDGRLTLFNPAFLRIWKLERATLEATPHAVDLMALLRPFFKVTDAEWPELHQTLVSVALDREPRTGRLERADGSVLDYAALPLPDGAVLHTFLDITDSVRVEQALRDSNDALEAADRLKSEFIANITYQLRTPLTAIMGFAEILQNQYFGPMNQRQQDYCHNILEAGNRLIILINDILELSSLEAGFLTLECAPVDVAALVRGVTGVVADWARQEDLELEISCPDTLGTVELDERRIRQALFNLLSNAIKFTPSGGRVTVSASKNATHLTLTVSDNGIGIAPADQSRIFKRFERANIRTGQAGAGLGLPVVKSIVELHGGRIEIDSAPNRGSTIRCILPLEVPRS